MATIRALPHLYSSVERGYFPEHGNGFQTVALAEELVGTEDLQALEDASFYAMPRDRGSQAAHPVKEAFFRLPSGRYAIGRTVYSGTDALGRDGNYLAHHLVLEETNLRAIGGNPFAVLDAARWAEPGAPLTPQALPALELTIEGTSGSPGEPALTLRPPLPILGEGELVATTGSPLPALGEGPGVRVGANQPDPGLVAALVPALLAPGGTTALLIGDEARARGAIRTLFAALALEERLRLTFSTHFFGAEHLRPLFALVAVRSRTEAPARLEQYRVFDLGTATPPQVSPGSAYAEWLTVALREGEWDEIAAVNNVLNRARSGCQEIAVALLPPGKRGCEALWEQVPEALTRALPGDATRVREFLSRLPSPCGLADALLTARSPSELLGENSTPEEVAASLETLRTAASPRVWRRWVRRWEKEPLLASVKREKRPWWRRWAKAVDSE